MKTLVFMIASLLSLNSMGQQLSYENLKNLIGERISDFEEFFKVESSRTDDNFGNLSVHYQAVQIDDFTLDLVLATEVNNIKKITVPISEHRTSYVHKHGC